MDIVIASTFVPEIKFKFYSYGNFKKISEI